jgi:hypothetical protein
MGSPKIETPKVPPPPPPPPPEPEQGAKSVRKAKKVRNRQSSNRGTEALRSNLILGLGFNQQDLR